MLSLLILGKQQVKDLNVYLAPLIDDLQDLWRGIDVVDMSKSIGQRHLIFCGILAWTIHDFPGHGFCSGKWFRYIHCLIHFLYIYCINHLCYVFHAGICTKGYKVYPLW